MASVQKEITINTGVGKVFDVITDYERYCEFLPELKRVEVLSREQGCSVVCFDLEIVMRFSYTLELREGGSCGVKWILKESKLMSINEGFWDLRPDTNGGTNAIYRVDVGFRAPIPKTISDRLTGVTLPQTLQRFKDRCEASTGGAGQ